MTEEKTIGNAPKTQNLSTLALALLIGCQPPGDDTGATPEEVANVVEVTAAGLTFEAPDTIPAGWTTLRFANGTEMVHFVFAWKMPVGYGVEEHQELLAPVFQEGMDHLAAGDADAAMATFNTIPAWSGEMVPMGGPGLTGAGEVSRVTQYLEPGTYLLECYVKTDGIFHSYNSEEGVYGMVEEVVVVPSVDGPAGGPTADLELVLTVENGIQIQGEVTPGEHTVEVTFADQTTHANFAGHDIHVAQLTPDTDLGSVEHWMDWTQPTGLQTPAPVRFVAGLNEMPATHVGYFTVTLEAGERYAFISEVPDARAKGLFTIITVPEG